MRGSLRGGVLRLGGCGVSCGGVFCHAGEGRHPSEGWGQYLGV